VIEVNGMAHVILTVSQWDKARAFYAELLPFPGMTKVYDGNNFLYHVGGRTAIGPCPANLASKADLAAKCRRRTPRHEPGPPW